MLFDARSTPPLTNPAQQPRDGLPMIPRLTLLLLLLLGLALGPVRGVAACEKTPGATACQACCADPAAACCAVSCGTLPETPPAQTAPAADDGKQLVSPTLTFLGFSPAPVMERPAVRKLLAARMPVVARLDLICVRLI